MNFTAWNETCKNLSPALVEACSRASVAGGPGELVRELKRAAPDWHFRHVLCRGGWYRPGGLLAADGNKIADSLENWLEAELAARDGDLAHLAEDFAGQDLSATRIVGRSHYLVASSGDGADDFLQLEIEDLQEVRAHRLFADDSPPQGLEDLLDPRQSSAPAADSPLGLPVYAFRRLTHAGAFVERMRLHATTPGPVHRFLADWQASSAGRASAFCNHWVLALREHIDRYRQNVAQARPLPTLTGDTPEFPPPAGLNGMALAAALAAFDRAVGYPMAWFFHMVCGHAVPHAVAQTVVEDALAGGFAYLPQRDIDVVRHWLHAPYAV